MSYILCHIFSESHDYPVIVILLSCHKIYKMKNAKWNWSTEEERTSQRSADQLFGGRENADIWHIPQSVHYNVDCLKQKVASGSHKGEIYQIISTRGSPKTNQSDQSSTRIYFANLKGLFMKWRELLEINISGEESSLPIFEVKTKSHGDEM